MKCQRLFSVKIRKQDLTFHLSPAVKTGRHFMKIVSSGDNFHEMSTPVFCQNKKTIIKALPAEFSHSVPNVKSTVCSEDSFMYLLYLFKVSIPKF